MSSALPVIEQICRQWVGVVGAASVGGGIAILIAWVLCRGIARISPGVKCWVWRAALLKLVIGLLWVTPVAIPVLRSLASDVREFRGDIAPHAAVAGVGGAEGSAAVMEGPALPDSRGARRLEVWAILVIGLWLVGVAAFGWMYGVRLLATRRLRARCAPISSDAVADACKKMARALAIVRPPALMACSGVSGPLLLGAWRPVIVLPEGFDLGVPREMEAMLAHELAHFGRQDTRWAVLAMIARAVFWFHPLAWLAERELGICQESACDHAAIGAIQARPAEYGRMLLDVAVAPSRRPRLIGLDVVSSYSTLHRRLSAMRHLKAWSARRQAVAWMVVVAVGVCGIVPWRLTAQQPGGTGGNEMARGVLSSARQPAVLLVTEGNLYLEEAMASLGLETSESLRPGEYERRQPRDFDVVIFDRYTPGWISEAGSFVYVGTVPPKSNGPGQKIAAATDALGNSVMVTGEAVREWVHDHPILKDLRLNRLWVQSALMLQVPQGAQTLVEGSKAPLIVLAHDGSRTNIVIGFDVAASNWPLDQSFPTFWHRTVQFLAAGGAMNVRGRVRQARGVAAGDEPTVANGPATRPAEGTADAATRNTALGSVLTDSMTIRASRDGVVVKVRCKPGDRVTKGQELAHFDEGPTAARLREAKTILAKDQLLLSQELSAQQSITGVQLATAKASVAFDEAQVAAREQELASTSVLDPMAGILSDVSVHEGEFVSKGTPLMVVVSVDNPGVSFYAMVGVYSKLKVGQPVEFKTAAFSDAFTGKIRFISPVADIETGTVMIHADIDDPTGRLRPGFLGEVSFWVK